MNVNRPSIATAVLAAVAAGVVPLASASTGPAGLRPHTGSP